MDTASSSTDDSLRKEKRSRQIRALLRIFVLVGLPALFLFSIFCMGVYRGGVVKPASVLAFEQRFLGMTVSEALMQRAEQQQKAYELSVGAKKLQDKAQEAIAEAKKAVAAAESEDALDSTDSTESTDLTEPADSPNPSPSPQKPGPKAPPQEAPDSASKRNPPSPDPAPAKAADKNDKPGKVAGQAQPGKGGEAQAPAQPQFPAAGSVLPSPAKPSDSAGQGPSDSEMSIKDRFELPKRIRVKLVADDSLPWGARNCTQLQNDLLSVAKPFRSWLGIELVFHGCVTWNIDFAQPSQAWSALHRFGLDGADMVLGAAMKEHAQDSSPPASDVFNQAYALAIVHHGTSPSLRKSMVHAVAKALGARELSDPNAADVRRGSVMATNPNSRDLWLDDTNRLRVLQRKTWPLKSSPSGK